jgi:hypothetical protein
MFSTQGQACKRCSTAPICLGVVCPVVVFTSGAERDRGCGGPLRHAGIQDSVRIARPEWPTAGFEVASTRPAAFDCGRGLLAPGSGSRLLKHLVALGGATRVACAPDRGGGRHQHPSDCALLRWHRASALVHQHQVYGDVARRVLEGGPGTSSCFARAASPATSEASWVSQASTLELRTL